MAGIRRGEPIEAEQLSGLIGAIYDCALKPELWPAALERLCGALDAKAASVHLIDPVEGRASLFAEHGTDPVWTALLLSKYAAMSPIGAAVLVADLEHPVGAFDFVDEQEFVESRFYKEWCAPQGYHDMMGALIAKKPREVGAVSATRLVSQENFGEDERRLMGLVAPHVRRAVTISGLLQHRSIENAALTTVIDQLSVTVALVDRRGRIVQTNAAAREAIAAGQMIAERGGELKLVDKDAERALVAGLADGVAQPMMLPLVVPDRSRQALALLPVDLSTGLYAVFLHAVEPDLPASARQLMEVFGLTPREVSVLVLLLEGRTTEDIAEHLGVGLPTVRTHVQRLLAKSGTTRQADLVRVVMQAMPPVRME